MQELSGAGGNWRVIDEIVDANVVQQQDNLSCGPGGTHLNFMLTEYGMLEGNS